MMGAKRGFLYLMPSVMYSLISLVTTSWKLTSGGNSYSILCIINVLKYPSRMDLKVYSIMEILLEVIMTYTVSGLLVSYMVIYT